MSKQIEYIKVTKEEFVDLIQLSQSKGMYTVFGGSCMGCQFVYGDARVYKDHNHIIAMINHESYTFNIESKFYSDVTKLT